MPDPSELFPYRNALAAGRPVPDPFRHPRMPVPHRAKVFHPFDALEGFSFSIAAMGIIYSDRIEPGEEDQAELSRKLAVLHSLTMTGKQARENRVSVKVTYFVPCEDPASPAFGIQGTYLTAEGVCRKVDPDESRTVQIGETVIPIRNILLIESEDRRLSDPAAPCRDSGANPEKRDAS